MNHININSYTTKVLSLSLSLQFFSIGHLASWFMASTTMQHAHILIIPFPAQGHMLPLLDLAHLLSLRHQNLIRITIAVTHGNLPLLSPLLSSSPPNIHPLSLPFPTYPALPPNIENTKDLRHPGAFQLLMHALSRIHAPLLHWARSVDNPPVAIISDFFLGWTQKLATDLNIPRVTFSPSGALALAITNYLWKEMPAHKEEVRFESLPGSPLYKWNQISSLYQSYIEGDEVSEFIRDNFLANVESWGFVLNTFDDLESEYLDHMKRDLGHSRVWAVGPLSLSTAQRGGPSSTPLMSWLDGCEAGSVIYVCFGSQTELSEAQAEAVGVALERSGVHFVWCIRAGAAGPEDGARGKGLVVRGWAPQVEVLEHAAVGWFLTHCGWNSVLEGIVAGVGMLTWPMRADQFYNARIVVEEVKTGVRVCEGSDLVPDAEELGRILAGAVGGRREEEKRRAKELKGKAIAAMKESGSSWRDLDDMLKKLTEECYC